MNPPIFSMTPETPRSEEKTASAKATNRITISTVSVFRPMELLKLSGSLGVGRRGTPLWRFGDRFYPALFYERDKTAAPEPHALRVFPGSVGFN